MGVSRLPILRNESVALEFKRRSSSELPARARSREGYSQISDCREYIYHSISVNINDYPYRDHTPSVA
ncbi:hypothetical protein ABKN59_006737 [Abortiporus biennis]